jgi:hypothetical protein
MQQLFVTSNQKEEERPCHLASIQVAGMSCWNKLTLLEYECFYTLEREPKGFLRKS